MTLLIEKLPKLIGGLGGGIEEVDAERVGRVGEIPFGRLRGCGKYRNSGDGGLLF